MFFAEHTCVDDGKAIYRLSGNKRGIPLLPTLTALTGKKYDKVKKLMRSGECSYVRIRRTDGSPFTVNLDGDLIKNITECNAEIVHKGLSFVVPKGVRV